MARIWATYGYVWPYYGHMPFKTTLNYLRRSPVAFKGHLKAGLGEAWSGLVGLGGAWRGLGIRTSQQLVYQ